MDALNFGTAVRDITPAHPVWAHGYANRTRRSSGVLERLSLGCLAVSNGEARVLIFALDMIGVKTDVCEDLYALLEKETGVGYPHILISGSHTHFASALHGTTLSDPEVGFVDPEPDYVDEVKVKLVEAAHEALGTLRPMRLETARIQVPQVVFNRRTVRKSDGMVEMNLLYPEDVSPYTFSPVDSELTVHRMVDENGVQAVLANFGCHPVTGCSPDEDTYRFSADYPYYMRQTIAEAWHCPVFFTLGAAGDAVPMNRKGDSRERIGSILGHAAVLAERTFQVDPSLDLGADSVTLDVETIVQTPPATAEAEYEDARRVVLSAQEKKGDTYREQVNTFRKKMMVCSRARLYPENKAEIKVQFVRVGSTVFVGLGFEVLAEASLKMKARFPNSVLVSCCGGYQGYLPLAYEYDRGGYEATESSTHFVPGTADRVLDAVLQWIENDAS
ncbi:MAG: neutral/alkaline non-lysosomal ceramidase N-terminal domain-containing protein [bacterium]|nr:neutral/alkaline non-lysosomal ceramidase N-terminal domain-containing protein [bacterium]